MMGCLWKYFCYTVGFMLNDTWGFDEGVFGACGLLRSDAVGFGKGYGYLP